MKSPKSNDGIPSFDEVISTNPRFQPVPMLNKSSNRRPPASPSSVSTPEGILWGVFTSQNVTNDFTRRKSGDLRDGFSYHFLSRFQTTKIWEFTKKGISKKKFNDENWM